MWRLSLVSVHSLSTVHTSCSCMPGLWQEAQSRLRPHRRAGPVRTGVERGCFWDKGLPEGWGMGREAPRWGGSQTHITK